jgi:HD-like signal output (HDOD) protein
VGELLDSPRSGTAEIAVALSADPAFLARLLRLVNSAYYDLPVEIKDAKHAVAYLGRAETGRLAATVAVMSDLRPDDEVEFRSFWYHAFHSALAAKALAIKVARGTDTEEIPVAALLHDVGKLVYLKFFPREFSRLTEYRRRHDLTTVEAEAYLGLPSHTELGARLCELWRLPEPVRRACLSHELPDLQSMLAGDEAGEELRIVSLANLLSNLCIDPLTEEMKTAIHDAASRALALRDEAEFLLLMGELYELGSKVEGFLGRL